MHLVLKLVDGRTVECAVSGPALERIERWMRTRGSGKLGLRTLTGTRVWLRAPEVRSIVLDGAEHRPDADGWSHSERAPGERRTGRTIEALREVQPSRLDGSPVDGGKD